MKGTNLFAIMAALGMVAAGLNIDWASPAPQRDCSGSSCADVAIPCAAPDPECAELVEAAAACDFEVHQDASGQTSMMEVPFAQPADRALRSRLNHAMLELEREGDLVPFTDVPRFEEAAAPVLPEPGEVQENLTPQALYHRLASATVMVHTGYKCDRCTNWHGGVASGFIVHPDGWIMTAGHVVTDVERDRHLAVMLHDESLHPIEGVIAFDGAVDVALLKISASGLTHLPIARTTPPPGTPVSVLSHPNGHFFILTRGVVSRVLGTSALPRERLQITAPFAIGSSGAAVVDDRCEVVGLALSTEIIFADPGDEKHPQLVIPSCTPAESLREAAQQQ